MEVRDLKSLLLAALLAASVGLTACGGDDDDDYVPPATGGGGDTGGDGDGGSTPTVSSGVFVDSPVAGVSYKTTPGERSGKTDAEGKYEFVEGDVVTFSIGGIEFPAVSAKGTVTPLDMGGDGADLTSPVVINILRVLQTLDSDGDPENGISISDETANQLAGVEIKDFSENFDSYAVAAIEDNTSFVVVDDITARNHFESSLKARLAGSWVLTEENGSRNVFTFLPLVNQYLIAHESADDDEQRAASVEYGKYTWDPVSGSFSVELIKDSDGSGGLVSAEHPTASDMSIVLDGDQLTLTLFGEGAMTLTPVKSADNPLVGSWILSEGTPGDFNVLTVLSGSEYVIAHTDNKESYDLAAAVAASSEWNSYTYSEGKFVVGTPKAELDGDGGLYNKDAADELSRTFSVEAQSNGDLDFVEDAMGDGAVEQFAFRRIGSFSFTLVNGDNQQTVVVTRVPGTFVTGATADYDLDLGNDEIASLHLANDGTGSLTLEGDGTRNVTTWTVISSGTLVFEEMMTGEAETTEWRISPIVGKSGSAVLVEVDAVDGPMSTIANVTPVIR